MRLALKRKDKEIPKVFMRSPRIRPYVLRPDCPFYGFSLRGKLMTDSKGNQCALKTESYDPCQMEIIRDKPNWYKCPLNTEENGRKLVESLEKIRVFPREFRPAKAKSWDGMTLKVWMRHIADMATEE